jgi:hypothetical protein
MVSFRRQAMAWIVSLCVLLQMLAAPSALAAIPASKLPLVRAQVSLGMIGSTLFFPATIAAAILPMLVNQQKDQITRMFSSSADGEAYRQQEVASVDDLLPWTYAGLGLMTGTTLLSAITTMLYARAIKKEFLHPALAYVPILVSLTGLAAISSEGYFLSKALALCGADQQTCLSGDGCSELNPCTLITADLNTKNRVRSHIDSMKSAWASLVGVGYVPMFASLIISLMHLLN